MKQPSTTAKTKAETEAEAKAQRDALAAIEPLAYSPEKLAVAMDMGKSTIYEAIGKGELAAHKYGRRTFIFIEDVQRWKKTHFKALDLNA